MGTILAESTIYTCVGALTTQCIKNCTMRNLLKQSNAGNINQFYSQMNFLYHVFFVSRI